MGTAVARVEKVGRYAILERIGRGATATVYRAQDLVIERVVALKTVPRPSSTSPAFEHETFARFLREARAAGRLAHPNVVTVYDVGEDTEAGLSYIAMELVEGQPLDRCLRQREHLGFARIRSIAQQVASALEAAHRVGVIHRDIKPANLILTSAGVVKVTDFGIAKLANAAMTQDGSFLGSPSYMSPEQVRATDVDARTDLFSLGTVLYELSTLRPAFPGSTVYEVITRVATTEAPQVREFCPDIPEDLAKVIERAMAKSRDQRFASAREMLDTLAAGEPSGEAAPGPPGLARRKEDRAGRVAAAVPSADPAAVTVGRTAGPKAVVAGQAAPRDVLESDPDSRRTHSVGTAAGAQEDTASTHLWVAPPSRPVRRQAVIGSLAIVAALVLVALLLPGRGVAPEESVAAAAADAASGETVADSASEAATTEEATSAAAIDRPAGMDARAGDAGPAALAPPPGSARPIAVATTPARPARAREDLAGASRPAATPLAVVVSEAAPTEPTGEPAGTTILLVEHRHRFGACRGVLRLHADRVEFDSEDRDRDDRAWPLADVEKLRLQNGEVEVVVDEKEIATLGLRARRYRFVVVGEPPAAAIEHLTRIAPGR